MEIKEKLKILKKVSISTIIINSILSILKITVGTIGFSSAIVADGVHSFTDVFTTIIAYVGVKMSSKKADEDHQYGHEKLESVMSKLLANILILTALYIGYKGILNLFSNKEIITPSKLNLVVAIISIIVKENMYHYTLKASTKIKSSALKADAWHHRSDAMSSVGSLIGVGGAILGYSFFDPLASIVIAIIILKIAIEIYIKSVNEVIDKAASDETIIKIKEIVSSIDGVIQIDLLLTRQHANLVYVDLEIGVKGDLLLWDAHAISEEVHDKLEDNISEIKHCMVHVNPY